MWCTGTILLWEFRATHEIWRPVSCCIIVTLFTPRVICHGTCYLPTVNAHYFEVNEFLTITPIRFGVCQELPEDGVDKGRKASELKFKSD